MLLDGTDLSSAFQPLSGLSSSVAAAAEVPQRPESPPPAAAPPKMMQQTPYDYDSEQRLLKVIQDLKQTKEQPQSYVDKLFSKKKDLFKVIQLALIVALGLAIHFVIKHYLKCYIKDNDFSCERQFFLRLLYPLAILFVLWNLKVFLK
jgi:hypothetical protein